MVKDPALDSTYEKEGNNHRDEETRNEREDQGIIEWSAAKSLNHMMVEPVIKIKT